MDGSNNMVVKLTQDLIAFDTVNPPGNEYAIAKFTGSLLMENGFNIAYVPFEGDRLHVIAEKGLSNDTFPIVFTGHFDTVPLGDRKWNMDPFGGQVLDGKLYGRGSSDMKGGVAAMVLAAIRAFEEGTPVGGVRLVLTSGEELGCQGANDLVDTYKDLGRARGLIVGEPTANIPAIGHKGGLYLKLTATGVTAHSSMPHLGENAIYKVARAILKAEQFKFGDEKDPLLGLSTLNVGQVFGGLNINSVPDHAGFTIDARTTSVVDHKVLLSALQDELGDGITIDTLVDLSAVSTEDNDSFVQMVYKACGIDHNTEGFPRSMPYLTDGSVFQKAYGGIPTVILGPGQPELAHRTDEFCFVSKLEEAVEIYKQIILKNKKFYE